MAAPAPYPFLSVDETERGSERFPKQKSLAEFFGSDNRFDETRDQLRQVAKAFFDSLEEADAKLLLYQIAIEDLQDLIETVPSLLPELVEIIEQAGKAQLVWLKSLAFAVAKVVSPDQPERAAAILRRALASQGFVIHALGDDLTLEHEAVWGSARSQPIEALWRERIFGAANDAVLAREILAAERFGAAGFIRDVVFEAASCPDSLDHAYAAAIAGYSSQSLQLIETVQPHMDDLGISGNAANAAQQSHQAAQWTEEWVERMWAAQTPEEFWRCLTIAKTCMDARVSVEPPVDTRWTHYAPVFLRVRKAALKERAKEREKKLLSQEAPDQIFVTLPNAV